MVVKSLECGVKDEGKWLKPSYELYVNPFPNNPWFSRPWGIGLWKTLWEKEKMLMTNIFSFSYNVFFPIWHRNYFLTLSQTTNFRLQNSKGLQTAISNLMKMIESSPNGLKMLWEKEKLLITSNFSFSHSVFKRLVLQKCKNQGLFGKGFSNITSVVCKCFHFDQGQNFAVW